MEFQWGAELADEVADDFVRNSPGLLVGQRKGLHPAGEVVLHHQKVFVSPERLRKRPHDVHHHVVHGCTHTETARAAQNFWYAPCWLHKLVSLLPDYGWPLDDKSCLRASHHQHSRQCHSTPAAFLHSRGIPRKEGLSGAHPGETRCRTLPLREPETRHQHLHAWLQLGAQCRTWTVRCTWATGQVAPRGPWCGWARPRSYGQCSTRSVTQGGSSGTPGGTLRWSAVRARSCSSSAADGLALWNRRPTPIPRHPGLGAESLPPLGLKHLYPRWSFPLPVEKRGWEWSKGLTSGVQRPSGSLCSSGTPHLCSSELTGGLRCYRTWAQSTNKSWPAPGTAALPNGKSEPPNHWHFPQVEGLASCHHLTPCVQGKGPPIEECGTLKASASGKPFWAAPGPHLSCQGSRLGFCPGWSDHPGRSVWCANAGPWRWAPCTAERWWVMNTGQAASWCTHKIHIWWWIRFWEWQTLPCQSANNPIAGPEWWSTEYLPDCPGTCWSFARGKHLSHIGHSACGSLCTSTRNHHCSSPTLWELPRVKMMNG